MTPRHAGAVGLLAAVTGGKALMGSTLIVGGTPILIGLDKRLETALVDASPAWLTEITPGPIRQASGRRLILAGIRHALFSPSWCALPVIEDMAAISVFANLAA